MEANQREPAPDEAAAASSAAWRFLADAALRLDAAGGHVAGIVERLASVCVPALGDLALVDLVEDDALVRVAVSSGVPLPGAARRVLSRDRLDVRRPEIAGLLATGASLLLDGGEAAHLQLLAGDRDARSVLASLRVRSSLLLPLVARGRTLGVLTLLHGPSGRWMRARERDVAEELGRRAALVLENARLESQIEEARRDAEVTAVRVQSAANRTLGTLVEASPLAVMLLDLDGTVRLWNTAAERIFGWSAGEVLHRKLPAIADEPGEDLRAVIESIGGFQGVVGVERRRRRKDGSTFDACIWATAIPGHDAVRCLALVADISERKRVEAENARLCVEAQAAVRLRDEFLSVASHELRTPLSALTLHVQSLLRLAPTGLPPDRLASRLETIARQIERQSKLIDQLLDVSRLSAGRLELDLEDVDLAAVVREVSERFAEELERAGCHLTVAGEPRVVGRWDAMRLDQVITNLLGNAIKYGHGRPIEVALTVDERRAILAVRDHGIGIAPEAQARIFERFERAVSVKHYGGFGLGLWIARQIIEALGGRITVASEPGEGATFVVELAF